MRFHTLMMSLVLIAAGAVGCSQPEPVRAEYEPANCECVEQPTEAAEASADDPESGERGQEPDEPSEELTIAVAELETPDGEVEETEEAGEAGEAEEASDERSDPPRHGGAGVVNLNDASIDQLMQLPGVGPALAARIVEFRQQRRFDKPDHLLRVKGIGQAKFSKLAPMIAVDGPTTLTN